MIKINLSKIILRASLLCILSVAMIRPYLSKIFNSYSTSILFSLTALLLISIYFIRRKKINFKKKHFFVLSIIYLLPFFYNNAYLHDQKWTNFFVYIITILYFAILYLSKPDKEDIDFSIKYIILFSLATSVASWIGFFNHNFFKLHIATLLPYGEMTSALRSFPNANPGLTTHYSRNAFFIVVGIIFLINYFISEKNKFKKRNIIILMLFLLITLFLIGKRGHLLFLILSFMITYIIYKRISIKTIIKLLFLILLLCIFTYLTIKFVPGANHIFERIISKFDSSDVSNGRFNMYVDIYNMYKNNGFPIGWGQYASSTGYFHPGVHNDYIQLFCEVGIIGALIIIICDLKMLKQGIKCLKCTNNVLLFSIVSYNIFFLAYSLTGIPHYDIEVYILYFFSNSISYCIYNNYLEEKGDNHEQ